MCECVHFYGDIRVFMAPFTSEAPEKYMNGLTYVNEAK